MQGRHLHAVPTQGEVFACHVRKLGVTAVIELQGELDLAARKTLDDALESALRPGPVTTVVADLDAVTSADASTVSWLLHADALVRLAGGRFVTVVGRGPRRRRAADDGRRAAARRRRRQSRLLTAAVRRRPSG